MALDLAQKAGGNSNFVIAGLVPVIQGGAKLARRSHLDARDKPGHDKASAPFFTRRGNGASPVLVAS